MTDGRPDVSIKVYQTLLLFLSIHAVWQLVFRYLPIEVPNLSYLQAGASTLTIVLLCRYVMSVSGSSFERLVGPHLRRKDLLETGVAVVVLVVSGIGAWALLVLVSANIEPQQAFEEWGLVSEAAFAAIQWSGSWVVIYLLGSSVLGPIAEELVFRGLILERIRQRHGTALAIFVSSALFGLLHFDKNFLGAFLHGIVFAALAIRFGSLWPGIIAHALHNTAVHALRLKWGISLSADGESIHSLVYWLPELIGLAIGLLLIGWYVFKVLERDAAEVRLRPGTVGLAQPNR